MKRLFQNIAFLIGVQCVTLIFGTLFRLALFFIEGTTTADVSVIAEAFLWGLRFDNLMACVLILIPILLLFVSLFFKPNK